MTDKEILDGLLKCYRTYLDGDVKPIEGFNDTFYSGVVWAYSKIIEIYPNDNEVD